MFEAVNSVISNAPFLRGSAEQLTSARAAVVADQVASAPQAPYISPYIFVDANFDKAVLQIRDSETGDVLTQFPSEETLATRARAAQSKELLQSSGEQREFKSDIKINVPSSDALPQASLLTEAQNIGGSAPKAPTAPVSTAIVAFSAAESSSATQSAPTVAIQA